MRVCCHNWEHLVGNVSRNTIAEIWNGARIADVRTAVRNYDFSQGCSYCEWQIASRNFVNLSISKWDRLPVPSDEPKWPKQMEFSISNACNLECVMCNGNASSSIRAHREKLPPLPNPYTNVFFDELREYLRHLETAKFLGGEPFLQEGCFRIWEMLIEDGIKLPCHVTTNGTIFNSRVERVLDGLPIGISMSLDGFAKQTIESIRVNARYEVLQANLRKFQAYARERKTAFGLTFCLMRQNWQELGDFCLLADELGCSVFVNSVRKPSECSLYTLPLSDLARIVESLEGQSLTFLPKLRRNKAVFIAQLRLLRDRAAGAVNVPGLPPSAMQSAQPEGSQIQNPVFVNLPNSKLDKNMGSAGNLFVYAICGDAHVRFVNLSLQFLKRFTRNDILVVASRCETPIEHDQVMRVDSPAGFDNHQASIMLKTNLHRLVGERAGRCCYLDSDTVAVDSQIDAIFGHKKGPVMFAADHGRMRRFSRWAVQCGCSAGECDHLREAILTKFGIRISDPNWQHWNGGVFVFDAGSTDFLDTWHELTMSIFSDPGWKTRDQGTLIATVWKHGLQNQPVLPRVYNYVVDAMHGIPDSRRPSTIPSNYHIDSSYSLDPASSLPRPHLLHFINRGMGAREWKNWDEVEALLQTLS